MILETLPLKKEDELTLIIDGTEITVISARLVKSMNTCADAFSCVIPWEPDPTKPGYDFFVDEATKPYGYQDAAIYFGGKLQMLGTLYDVTHRKGSDGWTKDLEIYSRTADLLDSTVIQPYESNFISLKDRCIEQCEPFGIAVLVGSGVNLLRKKRVVASVKKIKNDFRNAFDDELNLSNIGPAFLQYSTSKGLATLDPTFYTYKYVEQEYLFPRVSAKRTDTVFEHLSKLASQLGLLISCTKYGDLLITKANTDGVAVATIGDDSMMSNVFDIAFKGRNRWYAYKAIAQSARARSSQKSSTVFDETVKSPRLLTFDAGDIIPGQGGSAASWKKNKSAADALTFDLPVNSWRDDFGNVWEPNTTINIRSKIIGDDILGFTFLIPEIEFIYENSALSATLSLKPPALYTSGEIVEPWTGML